MRKNPQLLSDKPWHNLSGKSVSEVSFSIIMCEHACMCGVSFHCVHVYESVELHVHAGADPGILKRGGSLKKSFTKKKLTVFFKAQSV